MRIGIVVDSTCDLPESYFKKNNIQILPISIRLGDELLVDKRDAQATRRFYQEQLDSEGIHTLSTKAPSSSRSKYLVEPS